MNGKELLKYFKGLSEQDQNKILVDAFVQIYTLHDSGRSFDSFNWKDCSLKDKILMINGAVNDNFNEETLQRNLMDYAGIIYCLATGSKSAEFMSWDAGRKIQSSVLREIVLTICGRNYSVSPLLEKLRRPYTDEDTFFDGYTTVDEKDGRDVVEKQRRIDEQNRAGEREQPPGSSHMGFTKSKKSWFERIGIFVLMAISVGGYKACRASKEASRQQSSQQIQMMHQQRQQIHESTKGVKLDLPHRGKAADVDNTPKSEN